MKRVSVVFTEHEENGLATISELLAILERVKPEVIFLECPPEAFDNYLKGSHAKLEPAAVSRYREVHPVDLIPVDLPTPEAAFFSNYRDLIERMHRTDPMHDQFANRHKQYVNAHGFTYLNSTHCSDLFSKRHEAVLASIDKINDHKLAECYDSWITTNKLRDTAMMTNIANYCRLAQFRRAAFLVGAAHRLSIVELSGVALNAPLAGIQWDFASFLVEPQHDGAA